MPTLPKGHPDRPLYTASRLMIILGVLCLLAGLFAGWVAFMGFALRAQNAYVLTWVGGVLFSFGGGVALLFMAEGVRGHRRWALNASIVVTMLLMIALELAFFPLRSIAEWDGNGLYIGLFGLLAFGALLYQLFRSRRAIRLHETGAIGSGFDVLPRAPAVPVQALPAVSVGEEEVRERRWPIVACTALLLVIPFVVLSKTVSRALLLAELATVERELGAAVEQHLAALDPESEIAQRFGPFTGLRDVNYEPGFQLSPGATSILGATAQFSNAEARVVLVVGNGPAVMIERLELTLPDMRDQERGWRVELRGAEFFVVPPGAETRPYDPTNYNSERDPRPLGFYGRATHPKVK